MRWEGWRQEGIDGEMLSIHAIASLTQYIHSLTIEQLQHVVSVHMMCQYNSPEVGERTCISTGTAAAVRSGMRWHLHVVLDERQGKELLEEWGGTRIGHPDGLPYPINIFIAKFFK